MAINLAWEGQEAEAGLAKTSNLLKQTGIAALDAANNFSQMVRSKVEQLGLDNSQIKSLTKLSELDQERALARMEEEQTLRNMSKSSQLLYEQMQAQAEEQAAIEEKARQQAKARAEMLSKMTLLEKDQLFAKEKERALLMSMTPEQQKAYELNKASAEQAKADAEKRQKMLEGMSALDRRRFLEKEATEKAILGMTEKQQLAFEKSEKAKAEAQAKADRWARMSFMERIKEMLKGMNDLKATIEMVRGIMNLAFAIPRAFINSFSGIIKLGAELETTQIQMGALLGNFEAGAKSLENLRQITRDMGVPMQELVGSFRDLVSAGLNAGDAEKLLRTFSKIAPLLGQGGIGQITSGIAGMAQSGMAERSALDAMQRSGLQVYEALAEKLTNLTGSAYGVREAMRAVEQGGVLASTAILAMQQAANSPKALEAAQRISNSLEGQLARLKEGFTELLRDFGYGLLRGLDVAAFVASIRGVLEAVSMIVKEIVDSFLKIGGDGGAGDKLEGNFKKARDFTFDLLEAMVDGITSAVKLFKDVVAEFKALQNTKKEWSWANLFGSPAAGMEVFAAKEIAKLNANKNKKQVDDFGGALKDAIKKMRERAAENDIAAKPNQVAQFPANAGPQLPNMREVTDQFSGLRGIQLRASQKDIFNAGEIQSALSGFLSKMNQPDAGINQRIEAGSAAAVEAVIRNSNREGVQNIQEAIKAAVEAAKEEAQKQTQLEKEMLDALRQIKLPPTVQVPV
jgi:hypothetical protein